MARKPKIHTVDDGHGNKWQCIHGLTSEWCCLAVMRPGKVQCVCDNGLADLLEHHVEQAREAVMDSYYYDQD